MCFHFTLAKLKNKSEQNKQKRRKTQKNAEKRTIKINDTFKCNIMKNLNNEIPLENQALDLMKKPVCMMSGEELFMLTQYANSMNAPTSAPSSVKRVQVIGMKELAAYLGCCESTIYAIKKAGALDEAIISKIGHRYVFDAEHARQLADNYQKAQREQRETQ